MKKKYLVIAVLLMLMGRINVRALVYGDCEVLASYKLSSSLDEEQFICKGEEFGKGTDSVYYSGEGNIIILNRADIYYFKSGKVNDITLDLINDNSIGLLNLNNNQIKVTGSGSLKFKQNSYVKKVVNGLPIYQYSYNDKLILSDDNKIYEGTTLEFEEAYATLKEKNNLKDQYNIDDFVLTQVVDYNKMTSVTVTESWISSHIKTDLAISLDNGYGVIKYVEPKIEEKAKNNSSTLESDNVILISEKKVNSKYKLAVDDLKEEEIAQKVSDSIDKLLVGLYDVNVYNGKKVVTMKNGSYTIKIKLEDNINEYEDYQIIYVNDDGEIAEYIDAKVEDGYITFVTSHLSQYGVIATPIIEEPVVETIDVVKKPINVGNILKISLLCAFIIIALSLIGFTLFKSNLLNKRKGKRKRA